MGNINFFCKAAVSPTVIYLHQCGRSGVGLFSLLSRVLFSRQCRHVEVCAVSSPCPRVESDVATPISTVRQNGGSVVCMF